MAPPSIVFAPFAALALGMALQALLAGALSARAKGWLAFASGALALAGVAAAWPAILGGDVLEARLGLWDGPIQLAYRVDGLSLLFALMAAGIGAAVLLYAVSYMERERGATRFYLLVLLFIGGLIHLVYAEDLFLVYFSWELVGLCSFLLVSFWYRVPEAAYGARKVLTMTHLAGYGLLAAVVLLYARTGSTLWTDPRLHAGLTTGIFALVLVAALAKSVQFPLHTWIPDAMAAPTPVSALLHAACYVKAGVYLVARMHSLGPWPAEWGTAVSWVGAVTLLVGALFMVVQRDLKRLLAFSTVSQIGYMMLGLGLGTPLGIAAALFHCLNHGLFKGSLFLCAGAVQHATGTRDMDQLGGLGRRMPRTFWLWLVGAGSIAGVPLLNGFASKWLLYVAALEAGEPLLALLPWVGSVLTVFAFLKATSGVFLGSEGPSSERAHEAPWTMVAGGVLLAAPCALLGVAPQLAVGYLLNPALPALGASPLAGVGWLGLTAGQGGIWLATLGLAMGIVALAFGALVYGFPAAGSVAAVAGGAPTTFTGGEPLGPQGRLGASDFSEILKASLGNFHHAFDVDRAYLWLWRGLGRLAARAGALLERLERRPAPWLAAGFAALAAAVALLSPDEPRPRAAAAALLGPSPWGLAAAVGLALAGLLLACAAARESRRHIAPLALAGALALGGILLPGALARTLLLEAAALVALAVLWRAAARPAARSAYLAAVALSALGMVGGTLAAEHGAPVLALALLLAGATLKLGLVPVWFWLPLVAGSTPAVIGGLVVGVVDVAAFGELLALRGHHPDLFAPAAPWLALGVGSALLGALLSLAQRDLKRLLAFSTLQDMGLLVVALALGGALGVAGAALGAATHALAKALLFASVAGPEADGENLSDARGLASRHPGAAVGFLVGALSVLGVPPTVGYAAHWRIFAAAASDPWLLAALSAAAMLSVAVYGRAIALFWWGPAPEAARAPGYRRPVLALAVVLLCLALLAAGLWPRLLGGAA